MGEANPLDSEFQKFRFLRLFGNLGNKYQGNPENPTGIRSESWEFLSKVGFFPQKREDNKQDPYLNLKGYYYDNSRK